jgi:hypothetical protein
MIRWWVGSSWLWYCWKKGLMDNFPVTGMEERSPGSSVNTVTYDCWITGLLFLADVKDLSVHHCVKTRCGAHTASYRMGLFPGCNLELISIYGQCYECVELSLHIRILRRGFWRCINRASCFTSLVIYQQLMHTFCKLITVYPPNVSLLWRSGGAALSHDPEGYAGGSTFYW